MITLYFYKILHNYLNKWHIIYVNQLNDQEKKNWSPFMTEPTHSLKQWKYIVLKSYLDELSFSVKNGNLCIQWLILF